MENDEGVSWREGVDLPPVRKVGSHACEDCNYREHCLSY